MSQHNIVGSEVFGQRPFVILRGMRVGAFRRRKAAGKVWTAFIAGVAVAVAAGAAIAIAVVEMGAAG